MEEKLKNTNYMKIENFETLNLLEKKLILEKELNFNSEDIIQIECSNKIFEKIQDELKKEFGKLIILVSSEYEEEFGGFSLKDVTSKFNCFYLKECPSVRVEIINLEKN